MTPYENAIQRIKDYKKEGDYRAFLDLSNLGLETVPPELLELTRLNNLTLSKNKLKSLPEDFFVRLRNLYAFSCFENHLTSLPEPFPRHLRYLFCSRNPFKKCISFDSDHVRCTNRMIKDGTIYEECHHMSTT